MPTALEKAKAALAHAARIDDPADVGYQDLLVIAQLQAQIAQAEALDRVASVLERVLDDRAGVVRVRAYHG